jgi:transposase InsO family protein
MAMTNAQRQAAYRKRRPLGGDDGNGERLLNTWISTKASLALRRLARHYGVTQRLLLEGLLCDEDDNVSKTIELDTPQWDEYFGVGRKRK